MLDVRHLQDSVVTQLCLDYGMIDDAIYFTKAEVLGGTPLKVGDLVEKSADAWEDGGRSSQEKDCEQLRPLIGTITSFDGNDGYINQKTHFPRHSLTEGYEPMKGDWVQAKYFVNPTQWTTHASSVAPLRYCRVDEVPVTSVFGKNGVVNDSVFFTMDSLLLPANYQPLLGDLVNVVILESKQSLYCWRALCMSPCKTSSVNGTVTRQLKTEYTSENKGGLEVTDYGQFGDLMIGDRRELVFWIQNKGSEVHRLQYCDFAGWDSEEQFALVAVNGAEPPRERKNSSHGNGCHPSTTKIEAGDKNTDMKQQAACSTEGRRQQKEVDIPPGERVSIVLSCQAKSLGSCTELLVLHFTSFTIERRLEVTVGSESENLLQPSLPYTPSETRPASTLPSHVLTVTAPQGMKRLKNRRLPNFLPKYSVPQALRDCVEADTDVLVVEPRLGEVLSPSNLASRFSTLLWLEELHVEKEVKEFTIYGAVLRKGAGYLHLTVHGLTEGRPNLNLADRLLLKKQLADGAVIEYVCYVMEINEEEVSLRVNSDFERAYLGEPLDVEFCVNRLTMRRCHYALAQAQHFVDILFPSRVILQKPQWTGKWADELDQTQAAGKEVSSAENGNGSSVSIDMESKSTQTKDGKLASRAIPSEGHFFNPELNPAQREAVKRILEGECRPTPYVLFGPPGTGKTITLIEAILQVYHFLPSSRVLVCTPSNSAADLIAIRLHESGFLHAASLARINATCRHLESIPEVLRTYSNAGEDVHHAAFHRIVVSTCSSAGMLSTIGLQVGHFTHIFLDEAGQATEPESLIPVGLVSEKNGQVVLAGDPRQLGPVVKSACAEAFGLGVSLLERLMANPLYSRQDWGYNPKLVTKLIYNYRSHETLLTLPSKLFYQGELCFKAPKEITDSLSQWKNLPKKGFPLLFHGVRGTEMREGKNPSRFNPPEAVQVMLYCCQLAKKLYKPVSVSDIGIISPYRKQCEKIRVLLSSVGLLNVKVGSVEEFQGQEFLVIILSTVRSNESELSDDLQSTIGFLANPKRFNVAITRSKALLIVVGNPHILIRDPCFSALLHYTFENGAYLGCDPPLSLRSPRE
ncbi:RNA helicase Mov10l1 [Salarias fasciatus]|uniref:RNA helicase Mov10l1 n=1 Tax=Salarias fasciatus TaxID=181472 RepID=UPI001176B875|nr:RNA helicase Mov10l1 [Salarias fasciatus]